MAELRSVSTRAVITSTSFTNHYEWGDLKADPLELLEKYFDTFLYVANWGTRELYLRLPRELADYKVFRAMLPGEAAQVWRSGNSVIVALENQFEDDEWDDGTGWTGSLMSLRSDLLGGDLRCLYLGWLLCALPQSGLRQDCVRSSGRCWKHLFSLSYRNRRRGSVRAALCITTETKTRMRLTL
jgi:hypothetical protein